MFLFGKFKTFTKEELLHIARGECSAHGWPWLEPVDVQDRIFTWIVYTNSERIGMNVEVHISKRTGKVVAGRFHPR